MLIGIAADLSAATLRLGGYLARRGHVVLSTPPGAAHRPDLLLVIGKTAPETVSADRPPLLWVTDLDCDEEARWLDRGISLVLPSDSTDAEICCWAEHLVALAAPAPIGDLLLDAVAGRAFYRGKDLDLSPTSFSLLWHLQAEAGQVIAADRLQSLLWPGSAASASRLASAMHRLRLSLARVGAAHLLRSVRGRGYSLAPAGR